jgi:hypothetical protein
MFKNTVYLQSMRRKTTAISGAIVSWHIEDGPLRDVHFASELPAACLDAEMLSGQIS